MWVPGIGRSISRSRRLQTNNKQTYLYISRPSPGGSPSQPSQSQELLHWPLWQTATYIPSCVRSHPSLSGSIEVASETAGLMDPPHHPPCAFFLLCTNRILLYRGSLLPVPPSRSLYLPNGVQPLLLASLSLSPPTLSPLHSNQTNSLELRPDPFTPSF